MANEPKTKIKRIGGLGLVDIPGVKRRVAIGDVVDVPKDRADKFVEGGEFEHYKDESKPSKEDPKTVAETKEVK